MKTNAFVRGNSLDCYDWEAEDRLFVKYKIQQIIDNIALYQAYNIDKQEHGAVDTSQIIIIDKTIHDMLPIANDNSNICGSGKDVCIFCK
jgi:hypothetical protein